MHSAFNWLGFNSGAAALRWLELTSQRNEDAVTRRSAIETITVLLSAQEINVATAHQQRYGF